MRECRFPLAVGLALAGWALAAVLMAHVTRAGETLPGPIRARVTGVIDGDTLAVQARIWLGQDVDIHVRLTGIDAPELKSKCAAERDAAVKAREALATLVGLGNGAGRHRPGGSADGQEARAAL